MIQVRFVSYQYNRWMRAVDRLKVLAESERVNLPRKMSIDYIDQIRKNIYADKYRAAYPKYSERYSVWKYLVFKSRGGFWFLRGELVTSLKSMQVKQGWFGGIPAGVLDSGNVSWFGKGDKGRRIPIAQYAYWLEYGRAGQPSRPLFRPTLIEYYEGGKALTRLGESKSTLMSGWR